MAAMAELAERMGFDAEFVRWYFRRVAGTGGRYWVTRGGQVLSRVSRSADKLLRPAWVLFNGRGQYYAQVVLYMADGTKKCRRVHQLVLEGFGGPRPEGNYVCRHLDGDTRNNQFDNLAWGTPEENRKDFEEFRKRQHRDMYYEMGVDGVRRPKGRFVLSKKLTPDDVLEIRRQHEKGLSLRKIAVNYPVNVTAIRDVIIGRTWSWVK